MYGLTRRTSPVLAVASVVDDDGLAKRIREVAERSVAFTAFDDPLAILERLAERSYDVLLLDRDVPTPGGGLVLARAVRAAAHGRSVGIVLRGTVPSDAAALADAVLDADATPEALWAAIRDAGRRCRVRLAADR